jgi:parallel beta-helix repeat protein
LTSADSVYGNQVVGFVTGNSGDFTYQATINTSFQLSNVIGGNQGNGINLWTADDNTVAMNFIGTDVTGTVDLGNANDGILVTSGSDGNMIGGEATGGNDPTDNIFVRPPQGNLISGNDASGVLINGGSSDNQLSGNFIGTTASGNSALGNRMAGVAIENADNNSLLGCTFQQDPFVFYNVISGNGGNGLRVTNSNNTTIQADFFGLGADNLTPVGNTLNGVFVEGSSTDTVMGGPIPLGNVDAANGQNGIVVQDTASFFTSYNTFCGLAAFRDDPTLGNGHDGMLITSTGGNILIRTNVITENGNDGIELSGAATGVRIAGNIVGLNTDGVIPMGNRNNGIEVDGNAHNDIIGGPQPTFNIIPTNVISSNGANGVAIDGAANNILVNKSYIGLDIGGSLARPNAQDGVLLGPGTYSNTVGSTDTTLLAVISANGTNGVELRGTHNNTVNGAYIGTDAAGTSALGNTDNGILITGSSNNVVGRAPATWPPSVRSLVVGTGSSGTTANGTPTNIIDYNGADGVFVASGSGNAIGDNSIFSNTSLGIGLATGANANQQAPVLSGVHAVVGGIQVSGTLTSTPNTTFAIELYANPSSGSSGKTYLGTVMARTNSAGVASFSYVTAFSSSNGRFFTATATDPNGNTSEFSNSVYLGPI